LEVRLLKNRQACEKGFRFHHSHLTLQLSAVLNERFIANSHFQEPLLWERDSACCRDLTFSHSARL
jgi:hypothetical protein